MYSGSGGEARRVTVQCAWSGRLGDKRGEAVGEPLPLRGDAIHTIRRDCFAAELLTLSDDGGGQHEG
jgi:hypothetical protein